MKSILRKILHFALLVSLRSARKEQGYSSLVEKLRKIIPDLKNQYTSFVVEGVFLNNKVYNQHAFQVKILIDTLKSLNKENEEKVLVDIGDSSGSHIAYLNELVGNLYTISVNLDRVAVEKIRSRGLNAILCRAEELHKHPDFNKDVDIFSSFEMLEHLEDPTGFLRNMAENTVCSKFVISVPLVKKSRIGLHQIRNWGNGQAFNAETTHIFELSPEDWDLLFKFSGWKIVKRIKYTQYPRRSIMRIMSFIWRKMDFEGFYGVVLEKDDTYVRNYQAL